MKFIILVFSLVLLNACTTTPKKETRINLPLPAELPAEPETSSAVNIDYFALQSHLQMNRDKQALGFTEKPFNTCEAGYGYSPSKNCHREHFVVIHFRLLCRDSEGTISTILTAQDIRPLDRRSVRWNLKGREGTVQTDDDGYGQIVTATDSSQRSQRLRLALGSEFLYMRANEIQRVITPLPWCNQY